MANISSLGRLSFFSVGKYEYKTTNVCDFSNCPRPHTCMGLILDGEGTFYFDDEEVLVKPGDIIFVPITSRYVSKWKGNPDVSYVSMHFAFETNAIFTKDKTYKIQKVTLPDFNSLKSNFLFALENYCGTEINQLQVLNIFYKVLSDVFAKLKYTSKKTIDSRIEKATGYIDLNCEKDISIPFLAEFCNMSVSHFYSCFKFETGMTPIEYKHRICINKAIHLLSSDRKISIEEISAELGFYSSTYFRRVFKKFTGKTPNEYKKTAAEL